MMISLPKLALFASGNGSNLQVILDEIASGEIPAQATVFVSDKEDAPALERARKANVPIFTISSKNFASREGFDTVLVQELRGRGIDWVILAGFMRILSPIFVRPYKGRILNIHPALLPKYPGTHSIQRAFEAGEKEIGVTVHFVDEGVDTGTIIMQDRIEVNPGETLLDVTERVHHLEHRLYPQAIRKVLLGEVTEKVFGGFE